MNEDAHVISEGIMALRAIAGMRQLDAGYPCVFQKNDLVRALTGVRSNRERDYRVVMVRNNGVGILPADAVHDHPEPLLDEAVLRLGLVHSPNHTGQPCTCPATT